MAWNTACPKACFILWMSVLYSSAGHIEAETKVTSDISTELHGLQKHANYSVQVWAYTHVGDGVKSSPVFCVTDEAAPEPPSKIKVVASSPTSLIVSWMKPARPNGILISYGVYWRVLKAGQERDLMKRRLLPTHTHYEVRDLHKGEAYEFWVTASTRVGEGQSTPVVYATISNRVPAAIISFGEVISVRRRGSVQLPCIAVGIPPPERLWLGTEGKSITGEAFSIHTNGSLHIMDIQRQHQGNYTCSVSNANGSDEIVYFIRVLVSPSSPVVRVAATGSNWLQLQWGNVENGGSAVRGFLLNFRREEGGEWEERSLPRDATFYRLQGLSCGTEYQIQLMAYNAVGSGSPSQTLIARTEGAQPLKASHGEFLESNTSCITLHLRAWADNGCPISAFSIEYKEASQDDWLTAGNNIQSKESFTIPGLWPGTRYHLKVTATNSAGTSVAEYSATTLPIIGGTLGPDLVQIESDSSATGYLDFGVVLPVVISLIGLAAVFAGVCICLRRKPQSGMNQNADADSSQSRGPGDAAHDAQAMVALDNKHNLAQREQYYAAVQKGITHSVDRVPEYAEDISPYATFHVQGQGQEQQSPSSPGHIQTFVYHDHRLASMETMQLKSTNLRDDYSKLRAIQKGKSKRSESCDYSSSADRRSNLEPIPPRPGTRGERLSLQTLLYQGPSSAGEGAGPESSTSPEASPLPNRRNLARRHRHNVRRRDTSLSLATCLDPPTGFSGGHELSEAECDMDTIRRLKRSNKSNEGQRPSRSHSRAGQDYAQHHNFTIAV